MEVKIPHVLVVDDDPVTLAVLEDVLSRNHYKVTVALSGERAFALLKARPKEYAAVILDRIMPKMSGIDVLHRIYCIPALRKIPIIMLTSHAEREDVSAAVVAGVFDFLYKPIDQELLFLVLKRAISKEKAS